MSTRVDAFSKLMEAPAFTTKSKSERPVVAEAVDQIAKDNNFVSRPVGKRAAAPRRKPRWYRTGRNQHLAMKVTAETFDRFYKTADSVEVTLGELQELMLDAFEAIAPIKKIAGKKEIPLTDFVRQLLERAGESG